MSQERQKTPCIIGRNGFSEQKVPRSTGNQGFLKYYGIWPNEFDPFKQMLNSTILRIFNHKIVQPNAIGIVLFHYVPQQKIIPRTNIEISSIYLPLTMYQEMYETPIGDGVIDIPGFVTGEERRTIYGISQIRTESGMIEKIHNLTKYPEFNRFDINGSPLNKNSLPLSFEILDQEIELLAETQNEPTMTERKIDFAIKDKKGRFLGISEEDKKKAIERLIDKLDEKDDLYGVENPLGFRKPITIEDRIKLARKPRKIEINLNPSKGLTVTKK